MSHELFCAQNAISKTGLSAGIVVSMVTALLSLWTMYMLSALYQERKRNLVSTSCVPRLLPGVGHNVNIMLQAALAEAIQQAYIHSNGMHAHECPDESEGVIRRESEQPPVCCVAAEGGNLVSGAMTKNRMFLDSFPGQKALQLNYFAVQDPVFE